MNEVYEQDELQPSDVGDLLTAVQNLIENATPDVVESDFTDHYIAVPRKHFIEALYAFVRITDSLGLGNNDHY